jgi:hypothetical protein
MTLNSKGYEIYVFNCVLQENPPQKCIDNIMNKCGKMSHVIQCNQTNVCFLGEFFFWSIREYF